MTPDAQNPEESSREKTQEAYVLEVHDGTIATLTLNRPEARNSLSLAMLDALHDAIKRL